MANDLYMMMPGTFFQGAASRVGLGSWFGGLYLGGAGVLACFLPILIVQPLSMVMSISDLQRMSMCAMAVVSIPQVSERCMVAQRSIHLVSTPACAQLLSTRRASHRGWPR